MGSPMLGERPHTEEQSLGHEKAGAHFGAGNVGDGSDGATPPGSNRTHRRGAPGAPWPTLVVHTLYLTPGRRQDLAEAGESRAVCNPPTRQQRPGPDAVRNEAGPREPSLTARGRAAQETSKCNLDLGSGRRQGLIFPQGRVPTVSPGCPSPCSGIRAGWSPL